MNLPLLHHQFNIWKVYHILFIKFLGPNLCGRKGLAASSVCMLTPNLIDVDGLISATNDLAATGDIDPVSHINGTRVYIFHGSEDTTVRQSMH